MRQAINEFVDDLAELVFLVLGVAEIEIAAIMAEAVVLGIHVLPCPVLRRELTVLRIELGDVVALIVMQRPVEALARSRCAYLHRLHHVSIEQVHVFVGGHEDPHALRIPIRTLNGMAHVGHVVARRQVILAIRGTFGSAFAQQLLSFGVPRSHVRRTHGIHVTGLQQGIRAIAHETMNVRSELNRVNGVICNIGSNQLVGIGNTLKPLVGQTINHTRLKAFGARKDDLISHGLSIGNCRIVAIANLSSGTPKRFNRQHIATRNTTTNKIFISNDVVSRDFRLHQACNN